MNYSFKKTPASEMEVLVIQVSVDAMSYPDAPLSNLEPVELESWDILDDQGDHIATVFSEAEADALVSHLNR